MAQNVLGSQGQGSHLMSTQKGKEACAADLWHSLHCCKVCLDVSEGPVC